jgi:hypothetical protein
VKSPKPGPRHGRSLNPDFALCGARRSAGAVFAPRSSQVTCQDCTGRRDASRQKAAARLNTTRPVFCKTHNRVHTVTQDAPECAPGAWQEPRGASPTVDPKTPPALP